MILLCLKSWHSYKRIFADTMLMSYATNSTSSRHNLDALAEYYLNTTTIKYEDVIGKEQRNIKVLIKFLLKMLRTMLLKTLI